MPGTVVSVVKSISETSECVPVSLDISVDYVYVLYAVIDALVFLHTLPTEGKPTNPTEATPVLSRVRRERMNLSVKRLPRYIETDTAAAASTAGWRDELTSELC